MAGACGQSDLSEDEAKKKGEKEGEMGRSETARQQEEHNQKNTWIGIIGLYSCLSPNVRLDW